MDARAAGGVPGARDGGRRACRRAGCLAGVAAGIALATGGCAWFTAGVEHHFGPVLFRHAEPPRARARVHQTLRVGVAGEGGRQWSLAVGVAERVTVAPATDGPSPRIPPAVQTILDVTLPGGWRLSPLYLRVARPRPVLVHRVTRGVEVAAGPERAGLSAGVASRTVVWPPEDSVGVMDFRSRDPLDAVLIVSPVPPGAAVPDPSQIEAFARSGRREPSP